MATDKISSPLDRLVDENNKKNLKISRKHSKMYIFDVIYKLAVIYTVSVKKMSKHMKLSGLIKKHRFKSFYKETIIFLSAMI
jgi:hypothetical protein